MYDCLQMIIYGVYEYYITINDQTIIMESLFYDFDMNYIGD